MRRASLVGLFLLTLCVCGNATCAAAGFEWQDADGETTLLYDGRPALRYMHLKYDDSSDESRDWSIKPFHHVWSPDGATRLTKGDPAGLYPHHRGLFFGFNKVTYGDGKQCDVWHCTEGAHQESVEEIRREADDKSARHTVAIDWYGRDNDVFAKEMRTVAVSRPTNNGIEGWQIDFSSHVESADGQPIHLDGDPQHAGFHFRASQEVAEKTTKQTYYVRTDGQGKLDETRNWDPEAADSPMNAECENRPWNAMSFVVDGNRYTALYLDHPSNPKPARYSERDYGRFGSYFAFDVTKDMPLTVKYRVWIQAGEMTQEQCAALSMVFDAEGAVDEVAEVSHQR